MSTKELYGKFFKQHPEIKNPTDINCQEKLDFFVHNGFGLLLDMQSERKRGVEWTRREYWEEIDDRK